MLRSPLAASLLLLMTACGQGSDGLKLSGPSPERAVAAPDAAVATPAAPAPAPATAPAPAPAAPPAADAPTPEPAPPASGSAPQLTVTSVTYAGSGCPAGSAALDVSPDNLAFTLIFSDFQLSAAGAQLAKSSCRLAVGLAQPRGFEFTVVSLDWRGFADLQPGGEAALATSFSFTASGPRRATTQSLAGAQSGDFQKRVTANLLTEGWSGCNAQKTLYIDLATTLYAGGATRQADLSVDSADGQLTHKAGLAWRPCPSP